MAREVTLLKANGGNGIPSHLASPSASSQSGKDMSMSELQEQVTRLGEALERERKEGYAAARLHLTYEADLRAEIKALQEQLLHSVGDAAAHRSETNQGGLFSSIISW